MLTRCLFCDRQSKAKAAHFLGTQERLKEHIADGIRYVMAIVFHSNADGTVIGQSAISTLFGGRQSFNAWHALSSKL
jgi:hypothetical protein